MLLLLLLLLLLPPGVCNPWPSMVEKWQPTGIGPLTALITACAAIPPAPGKLTRQRNSFIRN